MLVLNIKDPVCGKVLKKRGAVIRLTHKGKTYYFCTSACHDKFVANPKEYLDKGRGARRISHTDTHQHKQFGVGRFSKHR
ncbi:hypothetical protein LCGC14_2345130 [marine sediment metagenome]|uniref:TRASH domain-containing protein n=1 Tax=marine sediment metagenome TaxID=412755 RepID=A0A0F9ENJ0_9ZZZZ